MEPAGRFMLRRIVEDTGLIDDGRKIARMPRREAIMAPGLNVEQFIEGIAIRQPGGAFLVGAKKVASGVESQRRGPAQPGGNDLAMLPIRRKPDDRAPFALDIVIGFPGLFVDAISARPIITAEPEIDSAIGTNGNRYRVETGATELGRSNPPAVHRFEFAGAVSFVAHAKNATFRRDIKSTRPPGHADRSR